MWNDGRPFAYDHGNFKDIRTKLLSHYLSERLGNCVSMPIFFLILADRLGLDIGLARAPEHLFIRHLGPDGRATNIEATSGGHPARDEWYRQSFCISDRAIATGLYLRTLSRRETVATMAGTVVEPLRAEGRYEELIDLCDVLLAHHPRCGFALVVQGSAYGRLLEREFGRDQPMFAPLPGHLWTRRLFLAERNNSLIGAAEALGWNPVSCD